MKRVFVDTSGLYAAIDSTDPSHQRAIALFAQATRDRWVLPTTNYVVVESRSLVQNRLGWDATDVLLNRFIPLLEIHFVDPELHELGEARCRQARTRSPSLVDCVSFEFLRHHRIGEAIAFDVHFTRQRISLPHG